MFNLSEILKINRCCKGRQIMVCYMKYVTVLLEKKVLEYQEFMKGRCKYKQSLIEFSTKN